MKARSVIVMIPAASARRPGILALDVTSRDRQPWLFAAILLATGSLSACRPSVAGAQSLPAPPDRAQLQDRYRRPELLVAALHIAPGEVVADVGAGAGYLTHRLAAAAGPNGRVVATDIDAASLALIGARGPDEAPIVTRTVSPADPGLEAGRYDLILLSEVDHLLADRAAFLRALVPALRSGTGRVVVSNRRVHRAALLASAARAGLSPRAEYDGLPAHFLIEVAP
ncbi:MAG TPA: methyltransferase [Polyangia bacterium]|jgi:SAM-dependent methyltransferase|nr:methyltransferase [Polyangia bacterium]